MSIFEKTSSDSFERNCTIFLGGLSPKTTEQDLLSYFSVYGEIVRAKIIIDVVTMRSKQCGIVFCAHSQTAQKILAVGDHCLNHRRIRASLADDNKKGTKKVNTKSLLVSVAGQPVPLNQVVDFFQHFGSVEGYDVYEEYGIQHPKSLVLHFKATQDVAEASKKVGPYFDGLSAYECLPIDLKDLARVLASYKPIQRPSSYSPQSRDQSHFNQMSPQLPKSKGSSKHNQNLPFKQRNLVEVRDETTVDSVSEDSNHPLQYVLPIELQDDPLYQIFCSPAVSEGKQFFTSSEDLSKELDPSIKTQPIRKRDASSETNIYSLQESTLCN